MSPGSGSKWARACRCGLKRGCIRLNQKPAIVLQSGFFSLVWLLLNKSSMYKSCRPLSSASSNLVLPDEDTCRSDHRTVHVKFELMHGLPLDYLATADPRSATPYLYGTRPTRKASFSRLGKVLSRSRLANTACRRLWWFPISLL